MGETTFKLYSTLLQVSILIFTSALVYFAFVYYPKAVGTYKSASLPQKPLIAPAVARSGQFPIETSAYRIVYEAGSDTYYLFVQGATLASYLVNKNGADLALKTALSVDSLCNFNIIYSSVEELPVPARYQARPNC